MRKLLRIIFILIIGALVLFGIIFIIDQFAKENREYNFWMLIIQAISVVVPIAVTFVGQKHNIKIISNTNKDAILFVKEILKNRNVLQNINDAKIKEQILLYIKYVISCTTIEISRLFNLEISEVNSLLNELYSEGKIRKYKITKAPEDVKWVKI